MESLCPELHPIIGSRQMHDIFMNQNLELWLTMKIRDPAYFTNAEFASSLTKEYIKTIDLGKKKKDGQVFTPIEIANYMASMVKLPKRDFSILDPGAGTGILLAAVCDRIINEAKKPLKIEITVYETDKKILSCLKLCLNHCISTLAKTGHTLNPIINNIDFIEDNSQYLDIFMKENKKDSPSYDVVIANPPYQKLPRESPLRELFPEIIFGRTNLYGIFIALGINLLNNKGQFVFFTPRSYCSGQYHKKIRELLLKNTCIKTIHSFESRHNIFEEHDVLQEVIIIHGVKTQKMNCSPIDVHSTISQSLDDIQSIRVSYSYIVPEKNPILNIHIPQTKNDCRVIDTVQSWKHSFEDLGFKISTGKVVDFRIKQYLIESSDNVTAVPLLWMQHLKDEKIDWPLVFFKKPQYIESCNATRTKLVPVQNYVLLRRFTSKEEERRVRAFPFFASQFPDYKVIGFENHLNYIFKINGLMTNEEANGISIFLNSPIVDSYYRTLSGNTQVNVSDLINLPIPSLKTIKKLNRASDDIEIQKILEKTD